MEEHINTETTDDVSDSLHVVVNLDQNVIAVCTETGEIKKHANPTTNSNGHFLRKYGASKRKRQRQYDDSSIWLFDAQEEDLEDEEKVEQCESNVKHGHVDESEMKCDDNQKMSFDRETTKEAQTRIPCSVCGESFRFADMYKYHKCIDTTKNKTCELCNFKYTTTKQYNTHLQQHLKSRHSVECPLCQKIFKKRAYLMTHLRSHSRHRLYQCPRCDKEFIHFNKFQIHLDRIHLSWPKQSQNQEESHFEGLDNQEKEKSTLEKEVKFCNETPNGQDKGRAVHEKGELIGIEKPGNLDKGSVVHEKRIDFHKKRLDSHIENQNYTEQSKEFDGCVTSKKRRKLCVVDIKHLKPEKQI